MFCKNCGKPITSIATECPYCHVKLIENTPTSSNNLIYNSHNPYKNNNTRYNKQYISSIGSFIASICIIIGTLLIVKTGYNLNNWKNNYYGTSSEKSYGTSTGTTYKSTSVSKDPLELVGNVTMKSSGGYGYYTYYIEGVLKNISGRKINYAQVSFVIYDMAGNNIGSAFDNVNYIDANGTWKFKAMYFGEEQNIKYNPVPVITTW